MLPRLCSTTRRQVCCPATALRWTSSTSNSTPPPPAAASSKSSAGSEVASNTSKTPHTKAEELKPKKKSRAELDREAIARFEDRFGGAAETQLGTLDENGRPTGMGKESRRNLFRLI